MVDQTWNRVRKYGFLCTLVSQGVGNIHVTCNTTGGLVMGKAVGSHPGHAECCPPPFLGSTPCCCLKVFWRWNFMQKQSLYFERSPPNDIPRFFPQAVVAVLARPLVGASPASSFGPRAVRTLPHMPHKLCRTAVCDKLLHCYLLATCA